MSTKFKQGLDVSGNIQLTGNITAGGNVTLGDADTDSVTISADITSNIVPDVDVTYDLGSSTKTWREVFTSKVNSAAGDDLDIHSGSDIALYPTGNIWIKQDTKLIFEGTAPDEFEVKLQALSVTADRDVVLPDEDGTIATREWVGAQNFGSGGGGTTTLSRTTVTATTASIADAATDTIDITSVAKAYSIFSIGVNAAAWVRVYSSPTARTNDASRLEGVDPDPDAGVLSEIITTGATTVNFTPSSISFNNETVPTDTVYLAVTNKSGSTANITITMIILPLEA